MKFYKCDYCGYKERKAFRIAKIKDKGTEATVTS